MRKKLIFNIIILITISPLLSFGISCCTPVTATPQGTLEAWLSAYESLNAQEIVGYETDDHEGVSPDVRKEAYERLFAPYESITLSNINITVWPENETTVMAIASHRETFAYKQVQGYPPRDPAEGDRYARFQLTKIDGKWLISQRKGGTRKGEKQSIENAVINMMVHNDISEIPNPVNVTPTNDMTAFPDATSMVTTADKLSDATGAPYTESDQDGYVLYQHDSNADASTLMVQNYVMESITAYYYTVDADGTIHQWDAPDGTEYID